MATSNANNTDSLPTADADAESKMESEKSDYPACGPQNDCNNNGTNNGHGDTEPVNESVQNSIPTQHTKRCIWCTRTRFLIAIILLLVLVITGMGGYIMYSELCRVNDRIVKLEMQCNSTCTTSVNKTQLNMEFDNGDLLKRISNLSLEIKDSVSTFMDMIQTVQTIHMNDTDQIRVNISTILADLTHINTSLTSSASNISAFVQSELSSVRDHSLMLVQNVSALTGQVLLLEERSYENVTKLKSDISKQFSRLMSNLSSNEVLLRDIQTEHSTTIKQIRRNVSALEDLLDQLQLTDVREHFTATLLELNNSLSEINANHTAHLMNLSLGLNNLNSELMAAKEEFLANTSAIGEKLIELSDNTNDSLTDLSSVQKHLQLDLADIKEIHSGNISSIGQDLVDLKEELAETNEHLQQNISSIEDDVQRHLNRTNEEFQSNISVLEQRFDRELNFTQVQLRHLSSNTSDLQNTLGLLKEALDLTKAELQNLSSLHVNLQSDYNATEQNVTQLREFIHQVERNHSSVLEKHYDLLTEAALDRSALKSQIDNTSKLARSQDEMIERLTSNVSTIQNSLMDLNGTLSMKVKHFDKVVEWIQDNLTNHSERITNVETKPSSGAVHVVPFANGFLLHVLSTISVFVCYIIVLY